MTWCSPHIVPLHDYFCERRLIRVLTQMRELGPPALQASLAADGRWYLREGSHRIRAAVLLRWPILLIPVPGVMNAKALERAAYRACAVCGWSLH